MSARQATTAEPPPKKTTEIILTTSVPHVGRAGDVVFVKKGHFRNYLQPMGFALYATPSNVASFEEQRAKIEARELANRAKAMEVAERLSGAYLVYLRRAADNLQLYGSIKSKDIASKIAELGTFLDKKSLNNIEKVSSIGVHHRRIVLVSDLSVDFFVVCARTDDEAEAYIKAHQSSSEPNSLLRWIMAMPEDDVRRIMKEEVGDKLAELTKAFTEYAESNDRRLEEIENSMEMIGKGIKSLVKASEKSTTRINALDVRTASSSTAVNKILEILENDRQ